MDVNNQRLFGPPEFRRWQRQRFCSRADLVATQREKQVSGKIYNNPGLSNENNNIALPEAVAPTLWHQPRHQRNSRQCFMRSTGNGAAGRGH